MTTPPRTTRVEADAAVARIARRRRDRDEQDWAHVDQDDPAAVLDHVLAHRPRRPDPAARADVLDCAVIEVWLWWAERERSLRLYELGLWAGASKADMGAPRGLGTQGFQDRFDSLRALRLHLRGDGPDRRPQHRIMREQRRAEREQADRIDARTAWLTRNRDRVTEVAQDLLEIFFEVDRATEWGRSCLYEVRSAVDDEDWDHGAMVWMRLAVQDIRVQEDVLALDPRTLEQRALRAFDDLDGDYTAATETSTPPPRSGSGRRRTPPAGTRKAPAKGARAKAGTRRETGDGDRRDGGRATTG